MKPLLWRILWLVLIGIGALIYGEILFKAPSGNAKAVLEARGVGLAMMLGGITLRLLQLLYTKGRCGAVIVNLFSSPCRCLFFFTCLFFLVRLPFYTIPFFEEDAYHANIFLTAPAGPAFFLTGRIDAAELFAAPTHPAVLYKSLAIMGHVVSLFIDFANLSDFGMVVVSRLGFSLFQYLFWIAFLVIFFWRFRSNAQLDFSEMNFLIGILILSCSPLAIQNSIDLQTDNTAGILLNGIFFLVFWLNHCIDVRKSVFIFLMFFGATLVGFGKNEWGLAYLAATFFLIPSYWVANRIFVFRKKESVPMLAIFLLSLGGILLGNIASYFYDPLNYMGGWQVFRDFGSKGNIAGSYGIARWVELTFQRLPYLLPIYILMALTAHAGFKHRHISGSPVNMLLVLYVGMFFGGYFLSSWGAYPRYFSTAFIGMVVVLGIYHREIFINLRTKTIIRVYAFLIVCSVFYIAQGWGEMILRKDWDEKPLIPALQRTDCIPIVESSEGYRKSRPNFVTTEEAKTWVESQGKRLCPR